MVRLLILLTLLISCKEDNNFEYIDDTGIPMICYNYSPNNTVTVCIKDTHFCKMNLEDYQKELAKTYLYTPFYFSENMVSMSKFLRNKCMVEFFGLGFVKESWWHKWSEE